MWLDVVSKAKKIFIVGVFPNSQDAHIWDALKNTNSEIYYVGSKDPFDAWASTRAGKKNVFLGSYFNNALDAIKKELKSP